jgi:hypothetical protein
VSLNNATLLPSTLSFLPTENVCGPSLATQSTFGNKTIRRDSILPRTILSELCSRTLPARRVLCSRTLPARRVLCSTYPLTVVSYTIIYHQRQPNAERCRFADNIAEKLEYSNSWSLIETTTRTNWGTWEVQETPGWTRATRQQDRGNENNEKEKKNSAENDRDNHQNVAFKIRICDFNIS